MLAIVFMFGTLINKQYVISFDRVLVNEKRTFIIENPLMSVVRHTKVETNSVLRTCS